MDIKLQNFKEVHQYIRDMPERYFKEAKVEFKKTAMNTHKTVSLRIRNGANDTLHSRTGELRRSLRYKVYGANLKELGSHVYTDSVYAPIQEEGGEIVAKNAYKNLQGGPYLNIPAADNKTPAGVTRMTARMVFAAGGYIIPAKGAKVKYAVMLTGKPMFWLVKRVTIPPRLKLQQSGVDEVPTLLSNLAKATGRAIQ